jgi:fatty acid desaturase
VAITDIDEYAHLSESDIIALGEEFDAIRRAVESSLGERDAAYIRRTIRLHRLLELSARLCIHFSRGPVAATLGATALATAKSIENMEIGHNVLHGQWDWMNDPEIHSTSWEWDMAAVSSQWRRSHNFVHHTYTNIVDMDDDVGFGIIRVTRDQQWRPIHLLQPLQNVLLAATFEWGIALHGLDDDANKGTPWRKRPDVRALLGKIARQFLKDFVFFPVLSGKRWGRTLKANALANLLRNLWTYVVIFCGPFPDGAEKFTPESYAKETRPEWYLRQMLGTANFSAGPTMAFMSGNLCYQIEHHLFPDLPSNRYAEISEQVRALCAKYDLPYTTGSLAKQYLLTLRTIHKLALPNSMLRATSDDAPETASELRFRKDAAATATEVDEAHDGARRGLRTALSEHKLDRRAASRAQRHERRASKRQERQERRGTKRSQRQERRVQRHARKAGTVAA